MPRDHRVLALVPLALALLSLAAIACVLPTPLGELPSTTTSAGSESDGGTTVGVGVSGTSGPPPPPAMTSDTGIAEPPPPHAWAMRYDEWSPTAVTSGSDGGPSSTGGNTGGTGGETGTEPAPDTLVVQLSTGPDDCTDPHAALECGGYWTITLFVPPELQLPGTYDLATDLGGVATISGDEEGPTCSFGAGLLEGTAELFEVSPLQVTGRLSPTDTFGLGTNFELLAPRC